MADLAVTTRFTTRPHHHLELVADIVDAVAEMGAARTLDLLRRERPVTDLPGRRYHDTRAVFLVWAADRLLRAGLGRTAVLWHPLVHEDSAEAWWTLDLLRSDAAATRFVPADRALPGEPAPGEPTTTGPDLLAA